jgi:hypothetical protein
MYAASGFCPDPQGEPFELDLGAGKRYDIVAVDPQAIGCDGRNDPSIVACAKHQFYLIGAANGRTAQIILQAGPMLHTRSLSLSPAEMLLQRLDAAASITASSTPKFSIGSAIHTPIQFNSAAAC